MYWKVVGRLLLAMIFGGSIGWEREKGNRPAGLRTHILVCMGSTLVMLTSLYLFNDYYNRTNLDPLRLCAQVISGVGFIGAGTIIQNGSYVYGLTTAASLWVVACIGLAIGAGFYWGAVTTVIIVYITLIMIRYKDSNLIDGIPGIKKRKWI